ncbi:peroxidase 42-like [Solanum pennellii]|uniref:Peroxidase 42-like n=1 Tax=Solanum pennellii TaxID=28526 RepID=A0ABM1V2G1_SOLPN|nr:peroxidase 42-like [Solanum pennellii]
MLSEMETDRSFGMRNFRYIDTIKEAVERESHDFVSCTDVIVLSGRDGVVAEGLTSHSKLEGGMAGGAEQIFLSNTSQATMKV